MFAISYSNVADYEKKYTEKVKNIWPNTRYGGRDFVMVAERASCESC